MEELIMKGFIRCIESGSYSVIENNRTTFASSIYEFSDKWQKYGNSEFEILKSEMTGGMIKKINNKKNEK